MPPKRSNKKKKKGKGKEKGDANKKKAPPLAAEDANWQDEDGCTALMFTAANGSAHEDSLGARLASKQAGTVARQNAPGLEEEDRAALERRRHRAHEEARP